MLSSLIMDNTQIIKVKYIRDKNIILKWAKGNSNSVVVLMVGGVIGKHNNDQRLLYFDIVWCWWATLHIYARILSP
ncbi:hypothetical protein DVQ78_20395 [Yersinia enterocolitica]|nr:hypothetical protein [Yersinia enterocolitica]